MATPNSARKPASRRFRRARTLLFTGRLRSTVSPERGRAKAWLRPLVQNAIRYRTTRITARSDTIRDYVFADDVGSFIADQVAGPRLHAVRTYILASGKPTSMMELVAIVQGTLQRQLFFQYEARPTNARDISVRPSALPRTWQPTPLAIGVYRTAERVMSAYRVTTG